ncbi:MAG: FAD-dependent monooxygenase [Pyrinomonadaceae bacterium]
MKTSVLIVGAGPTGLSLACQLIRHGVDFLIIDKKEGTTPYSKAIGVHARTLEIYEQIGLAERAVAEGAIVGKTRLMEEGEIRAEIDLSRFGEGMSAYPFLLILEQGKHEKILHEYITDGGKDVMWQTELISFSQSADGVTAEIRKADGSSETVEAGFLVGCDGAKSLVRHSLGLEFAGGTFERIFYVADVQIDWEYSHDALHLNLSKDTLLGFFPMPGGENHYRIVGSLAEGSERNEAEILYEEIEEVIKSELKHPLDVHDVNWFSTYKVHTRHVNKFSVGRCFLAGDSAHIHSPAGAQGMNTGIQDGYNLAWKLAMVLNGRASVEILNTYNEERLPNAKRLLKTTDRMFELGAGEEWFTAWLRVRVFPYVANIMTKMEWVQRMVFPLVSQIGINYRRSSLSKDAAAVKVSAGDRMPYFLVDGQSIYDRLHEPRFHLIVFSDGSAEQAGMSEDLDGLADVHTIPLYPHIAEIFDTEATFCVLLRPDNYIGFIGKGYDIEGVKDYLKKILS